MTNPVEIRSANFDSTRKKRWYWYLLYSYSPTFLCTFTVNSYLGFKLNLWYTAVTTGSQAAQRPCLRAAEPGVATVGGDLLSPLPASALPAPHFHHLPLLQALPHCLHLRPHRSLPPTLALSTKVTYSRQLDMILVLYMLD